MPDCPHGLLVARVPEGCDPTGLHPLEHAHWTGLSERRQPTWLAGRLAVRAALVQAGWDGSAPILATERGAPSVPDGFTASIAHKKDLAVGLAGRRATFGTEGETPWDLGVDIEWSHGPKRDLTSLTLTDEEQEALTMPWGPERATAIALRFALKEAIYKAIDPTLQRYVGFREVAVWPKNNGTARVDPPRGRAEPAMHIEAWWARIDRWFIATARARPA